MKRYVCRIPESIQPMRLFAFLRRMFPELPEYAIREAFEKRDVKMDGIRVGKEETVKPGAEIQLFTSYETKKKRVEILYEDTNLMVVRKPAGVSCEADAKGGKTIAEWVEEDIRQRETPASTLLLCHRLDNQTEGLLLLAKNESVQCEIQDAFQKRQIHKAYYCLVKGTPAIEHELIRAYLQKDKARGRVYIVNSPKPGALEILTEYEVVMAGEISRLRIILHTGRTHQIRAQMAAIGHPILGDDVYGDRAFNKAKKTKRLMLCAAELWFSLEGHLSYLNEQHIRIKSLF